MADLLISYRPIAGVHMYLGSTRATFRSQVCHVCLNYIITAPCMCFASLLSRRIGNRQLGMSLCKLHVIALARKQFSGGGGEGVFPTPDAYKICFSVPQIRVIRTSFSLCFCKAAVYRHSMQVTLAASLIL